MDIKIICNTCGKSISIRALKQHLIKKHSLTEKEYWNHIFSDDLIINIKTDYEKGFALCDLAKKYGKIKYDAYLNLLKYLNVKLRTPSESKRTPVYINKYKNSIIAKYGVDNISKSIDIKNKKIATSLKNNGYINNFCNKDIHAKAMIELSKIDYIAKYQRCKKTLLERYGVENAGQLESSKEVQRTRMKKMIENNEFLDNNFFKKINFISKLEIKIHNCLNILNIEYIHNKIISKRSVDIFIPKYNLIIEINGDYWHANPLIYKETDVLMHKNNKPITAKDIWIKNEKKINYLIDHGYNVEILWETDINLAEKNNTLNEIINNLIYDYENKKNYKNFFKF